jgi:DNA invertase Pin-like site-specific DNA recombinase
MTSEQLAQAVAHHIKSLENRIVKVGAKEYSLGKKQKIETKSLGKLLDEAIEELDDLVVYLSFTRLRVQKLRANLNLELLESLPPLGDQQG